LLFAIRSSLEAEMPDGQAQEDSLRLVTRRRTSQLKRMHT